MIRQMKGGFLVLDRECARHGGWKAWNAMMEWAASILARQCLVQRSQWEPLSNPQPVNATMSGHQTSSDIFVARLLFQAAPSLYVDISMTQIEQLFEVRRHTISLAPLEYNDESSLALEKTSPSIPTRRSRSI
jgi:hypothetical protein